MTAPTKAAGKTADKGTGDNFVPVDDLTPNFYEVDTLEKRATYWIGKIPDTEVTREGFDGRRKVEIKETVPGAPCQIVLGDHDFPGVQQPIVKHAGAGQEQERDRTYGKIVTLSESEVDAIIGHARRSFVRWHRRKGARDDWGHQITMPSEAEIKQGEAEAAARKEAYVRPPIVMSQGDEPVTKYIFMQRVGEHATPHGTPPASIHDAGGIQRP